MNISDQELQIFSRQLILKEFDENKFNFIQKQHVIIIGMGGIGCPLSQYLLTSGINITSFGLDEHDELLFCGAEYVYKLTSNLGDLNKE